MSRSPFTGELAAVLDGFTITNGSGTLNDEGHRMGGGIACRFGSNSTSINSIFRDNYPTEIGFYRSTTSNHVSIHYSDIAGGEPGVVTNGNGT
ncbi:MAG: hypothetical protein U9Q77_06450 [Candidatus Marinimicrobia bacterium]|nr:hypothetical protein [Candidatus Neomarinimicrobiota bacterium]